MLLLLSLDAMMQERYTAILKNWFSQ